MKPIKIIAIVALMSLTVLTGCKKDDPDAIEMSEVNVGAKTYPGKDGNPILGVDMGQGFVWAAYNIGAESPEQSGSFFAWAETATKEEFNDKTYKWFDETDHFYLTKYCQNPDEGNCGFFDKKTSLDMEDDAAAVNYGGKWRMPTNKEFNELKYFCDVKWGTLNGVSGFLFTSKEKGFEGNSIFFPLAGQKDLNKIKNSGEYGFYWTRQLYENETKEASCIWFEHVGVDNQVIKFLTRYVGLPIRAVLPLY